MNLFLECGVFLFLKEIPPDLVCDINRDYANTFVKFLLEKQKWPEVLLLLTRKASGEPPLGDCLIKDCDLSGLDLCAIIRPLSTWDQRRVQLLGRLVDSGGEHAGMGGKLRPLLAWCFSLDCEGSFKSCSFSPSESPPWEAARPISGWCPLGSLPF